MAALLIFSVSAYIICYSFLSINGMLRAIPAMKIQAFNQQNADLIFKRTS